MGNEIRSLRTILNRYWPHETPVEAFVQKGIQQIQAHETTVQKLRELKSAFDAASDDGSLIRTLHQEMLRRMSVS
jgi:hypothetical protein